MTKCNTDQLITPEVMEYLTKRQMRLASDLHSFEAERENKDQANIPFSARENEDMIRETKARRNELALMVTCLERTETDKRQKDLDEFESSLSGDGNPDGDDHGTFIVEVGADSPTCDRIGNKLEPLDQD